MLISLRKKEEYVGKEDVRFLELYQTSTKILQQKMVLIKKKLLQ